MEHSTSSAPNERVWRITQLAKFSFNHPSVVLTASWRLSIFFLLKEFNVQKQAFLHFFIVYFRTVGKTCAGYYLVYVVSSVWYCLVLTACLCRDTPLSPQKNYSDGSITYGVIIIVAREQYEEYVFVNFKLCWCFAGAGGAGGLLVGYCQYVITSLSLLVLMWIPRNFYLLSGTWESSR